MYSYSVYSVWFLLHSIIIWGSSLLLHVWFTSFLGGIPQFIYLPVDGHLSCFRFLTMTNKTYEHLCISLCMDIWSHFSWVNKYLEVEQLHHRFVFNFFKKLPGCFLKWLYQLTFSPAVRESFSCSIPLPVLGMVNLINFRRPNMCGRIHLIHIMVVSHF